MASFLANTALLMGIDHPMVVQAGGLDDVTEDPDAFWWALRARTVMNLSTNMGLTLAGQGDHGFALRQLDRWPTLLREWRRETGRM